MIDHYDFKYSGVHAVHTMSATDILPLGSPGSHLGRVLLNAVVLLIKPGVGTKAFEVRLQAFVLLTCLACSFTCSQDSTTFGVIALRSPRAMRCTPSPPAPLVS